MPNKSDRECSILMIMQDIQRDLHPSSEAASGMTNPSSNNSVRDVYSYHIQ